VKKQENSTVFSQWNFLELKNWKKKCTFASSFFCITFYIQIKYSITIFTFQVEWMKKYTFMSSHSVKDKLLFDALPQQKI